MDLPLAVRGLIFLLLPIAAGVVVSGTAVSEIPWAARVEPAPANKSGQLIPLVITGGENSG